MDKLPSRIHAHIFRFLTHPVADAIRDNITEFQSFANPIRPSDKHTFYIFFFLGRKLRALSKLLDEIPECMDIDSYYFRPSLWELYEKQFPGYFFRSVSLEHIIEYNNI